MPTCAKHRIYNCEDLTCRRKREENTPVADTSNDLANPVSPLHQLVYDGAYWGTVDYTPDTSSSACDDTSSSSSTDYSSVSDSSSSYTDSGSSSTDCGSGW